MTVIGAESHSTTQEMLLDLVFEAASYTRVLDKADAANFVDRFVEAAIAMVRKRPEISTLSSDAWRLIFADLRERARAELADLIDDAAPFKTSSRDRERVG
jgi:hypothetical protein